MQLPGREVRLREPPFTDFAPLVESVCRGLDAAMAELPFAVFGHSMGALLAFELARWRAREGKSGPVKLIVSAHDGPSHPSTFPRLSHRSDVELCEWLRRVGGTPAEVLDSPELLGLQLPILRADLGGLRKLYL